MSLTGGLLTNTLNYRRHDTLPKTFISLIRALTVCPHANAGWPIRCSGEVISSQHCYDCGAQRTYVLQPVMQRGPWKHLQLRNSYPLEIPVPSNAGIQLAARRPLAIS